MKNSEFLKEISRVNATQRDYVSELKQLPEDRLNAKASPEEWSVLECVDHMNKATELYLDQIEPKLEKLKPAKKEAFKKTWLANKFTKMLAPTEDGEIKSKMKTMKVFTPVGEIENSVIARFVENTERVEKIVQRAQNKNLRSFKVTTALGPVLKFYVGDALDFILAHNERHVVQIGNILKGLN